MKREYFKIESLSIQILQYEFLGPIPLEEWGPPMEKLVYLILSRSKDKFDMLYVGDCKKTNEPSFFTQHSRYKCWTENFGSGRSLYLAVLPLFESSDVYRENVVNKIIRQYKPFCNPESTLKAKSDYVIKHMTQTQMTQTQMTQTQMTQTQMTQTQMTQTQMTQTQMTQTQMTQTQMTQTQMTQTQMTQTQMTQTQMTQTQMTQTQTINLKNLYALAAALK